MQVEEGELEVTRGAADTPDAVILADVQTLGGLLFGSLSLADAEAQGLAQVQGNHEWAERLPTLFRMPTPVTLSGSQPRRPRLCVDRPGRRGL